MRTLAFGADRRGLVMYLVLEDPGRVGVLEVIWAG